MPGPVRYTKSGKVKKATPRKYESGKGWSKMAESPAAPASTRSKVRKSEVRKTLSRGDFGRRFSRSTPVKRVDTRDLDTRKSNREALGPVGDALATVAKAIQEPVDLPGTKLDRIGEILSILVAPRGTAGGPNLGKMISPTGRGATVRGVGGLRSRKAAESVASRKDVGRRVAERKRKLSKARRTEARRNRRNRPAAEKRRAREAAMERSEMRGWQRDEWNEAGPGQ